MDGRRPDPKKIIMRLHFSWGHASAHQLKLVLVDTDRGATGLANYADEVSARCEICYVFDTAPYFPIAGTSTVLTFNASLQLDSLFLGDATALRAMDVCPRNCL